MAVKNEKKIRLSVSIDRNHYRVLSIIAAKKKVSIAWVIRDSIENYIHQESPLFGADGLVAESNNEYRGSNE